MSVRTIFRTGAAKRWGRQLNHSGNKLLECATLRLLPPDVGLIHVDLHPVAVGALATSSDLLIAGRMQSWQCRSVQLRFGFSQLVELVPILMGPDAIRPPSRCGCCLTADFDDLQS